MDAMIDVKLLTRLQAEELLHYSKLKQRREIKARQAARVQEIAQKGAAYVGRTIDLTSPEKQSEQAAMDLASADAWLAAKSKEVATKRQKKRSSSVSAPSTSKRNCTPPASPAKPPVDVSRPKCTLDYLLQQLRKDPDNMVLDPPTCCDKRCPFQYDCLLGQRYSLARRLVQIEYRLAGSIDEEDMGLYYGDQFE